MSAQHSENLGVRAEIVAAKLAAVRNYSHPNILSQIEENPRLVELLWFLQAKSMAPGGLKKFASDFLVQFADRVGTRTMLTHQGKYTPTDSLRVWKEFPQFQKPSIKEGWMVEAYLGASPVHRAALSEEQLTEQQRDVFAGLTFSFFKESCMEKAHQDLPRYLTDLCMSESQGFVSRWYFEYLHDALFSAMDLHAENGKRNLAMTAVAVKVFDALDYAAAEKGMVRIEGDSRFGKTEAVKTWAAMRPGKARLVQVPCSNSETDLLRAVANALGIEHGLSTSPSAIRERVEYVLHHSRLFLILDEAHFLLPQRYSKNTPPMRLNWVRTQIVDKGLPLALVTTPQSYAHAMQQFVKATGYKIEQFLGRSLLNFVLPQELSEQDLIAVAKIHFPELDGDFHELLAVKAMLSQNYLQAMEAIAKRARYIAKRESCDEVSITHFDTAVSEFFGTPIVSAVAQPSEDLPKVKRENLTAVAFESTHTRSVTPKIAEAV